MKSGIKLLHEDDIVGMCCACLSLHQLSTDNGDDEEYEYETSYYLNHPEKDFVRTEGIGGRGKRMRESLM